MRTDHTEREAVSVRREAPPVYSYVQSFRVLSDSWRIAMTLSWSGNRSIRIKLTHASSSIHKVSYMQHRNLVDRHTHTASHIDNYAFLTAFATTMRCSSLPAHEQGKQFSRTAAAGVRRRSHSRQRNRAALQRTCVRRLVRAFALTIRLVDARNLFAALVEDKKWS